MEENRSSGRSSTADAPCPKMFWHGVQTRGAKTILPPEGSRHLAARRPGTSSAASRARSAWGSRRSATQPGEVVSILSNTNKEWVFADLGALGAAGVVNGIYPTDAAAQVEYLLTDSGSRLVFVEDDEQLDKMLEVRARAAEAAARSSSSTWKGCSSFTTRRS